MNTLIEINNDRIEGYETASKETDQTDLKILFSQFQGSSEHAKKELVQKIKGLKK